MLIRPLLLCCFFTALRNYCCCCCDKMCFRENILLLHCCSLATKIITKSSSQQQEDYPADRCTVPPFQWDLVVEGILYQLSFLFPFFPSATRNKEGTYLSTTCVIVRVGEFPTIKCRRQQL